MGTALGDSAMQAEISLKRQEDRKLLVVLSGSWRLASSPPSADELKKQIDPNQVRSIAFETGELKGWDSSLLIFALRNLPDGFICRLTGSNSIDCWDSTDFHLLAGKY